MVSIQTVEMLQSFTQIIDSKAIFSLFILDFLTFMTKKLCSSSKNVLYLTAIFENFSQAADADTQNWRKMI